MIKLSHIIFYVRNQEKSRSYYQAVLNIHPKLNVPGMTEFELSTDLILGLMPEKGIERLLGNVRFNTSATKVQPRAELYLIVDNAKAYHSRALQNGGIELSGLLNRDWGHRVAYSMDFDGNILALAEIPD